MERGQRPSGNPPTGGREGPSKIPDENRQKQDYKGFNSAKKGYFPAGSLVFIRFRLLFVYTYQLNLVRQILAGKRIVLIPGYRIRSNIQDSYYADRLV